MKPLKNDFQLYCVRQCQTISVKITVNIWFIVIHNQCRSKSYKILYESIDCLQNQRRKQMKSMNDSRQNMED